MKREYFRPRAVRLAEAARAISPRALFYRLSIGGHQIGYASSTVDTLQDSFRLVDVLVADAPSLGHLRRTEGQSVAKLDQSLHLVGLTSEVEGDIQKSRTHLRRDADGVYRIQVGDASDSTEETLPAGDPLELPSLWPMRLAYGGLLHPGRTARARVLDPFSLTVRRLDLRVTGDSTLIVPDSADFDSTTMTWVPVRYDTVHAVRVAAAGPDGGRPRTVWIDGQGHVVRVVAPRGFVMERTAFEVAYENFRRRDTLRLMRATRAPGPGAIVAMTAVAAGVRPEAPAPPQVRLLLQGGGLDGLDLEGAGQQVVGDTLLIRPPRGAALVARYRLPDDDPGRAAYRESTLFIPSTDLRVAARARLIVGRGHDPTVTARRLVHWVSRQIKAEPVAAPPEAVAVLARGRGDADAHAMLYVALARAVGLPARPVAGLLRLGDRFYYHAWAEVYLGDWIAVDPTFDQFPADTRHIRLAIDGLARPLDFTRLIGRLTLTTP